MAKIYIIFYTMYGHIWKMAQAMKEGVDKVPGCEGVLFQVAETLDESVLAKMHAPDKPDVPVITASQLTEPDGLIFGFPTRFGMMCAQMKQFFDSTGSLWQAGKLAGMPVTFFISTATQGGGQETTIMTSLTQSTHHGMIYIPPGYTLGSALFDVNEVRGGSAWGAGTYAGADGSRQPSELELKQATHQGEYFTGKALKLEYQKS